MRVFREKRVRFWCFFFGGIFFKERWVVGLLFILLLSFGYWSWFIGGRNSGEMCVCVWWVGGGFEEVGIVFVLLFVIGCCRFILYIGGDKLRFVYLI